MSSFLFSKLNLPSVRSIFGDLMDNDEIEKILKKNISELRNEMSETQSQLALDENTLCTIYRDMSKVKKDGLGIAAEMKEALKELQKWRDEMEDALYKYATSGWGSGKTIEEMFNELFDPFLAALQPLESIISQLGLAEIQIIGTIQEMLQKFSSLGRIISKLPPEIIDEVRKQVKEAKEAEEAKNKAARDEFLESRENKTWGRIVYSYNNSVLKNVVDDIVEAFKAVIDMIEMICSCAEIFAILLILDKFKPVIDQFKILIGDAITILENVKTLLKLIIEGKYAMLKFLTKVIWSKIEDIYNVIVYISVGSNITPNALISGCWMDIVSAECDLSSYQLSLFCDEQTLKIHNEYKMNGLYDESIEKVDAAIKESESETTIDAKAINEQKKRKEELEAQKAANLSAIDEDWKKSEKLYRDYMIFNGNVEKIYNAELTQKMSQDDYLNPKED